METKNCIACGMPMEKKEDFAGGDVTKDYCVWCSNNDGTMKSYDESLRGATAYAMKEYGITEEEARNKMILYMKTMPAWKDVK